MAEYMYGSNCCSGVVQICEYNGYKVYLPQIDESLFSANPKYVLVGHGNCRWAESHEEPGIMDAIIMTAKKEITLNLFTPIRKKQS